MDEGYSTSMHTGAEAIPIRLVSAKVVIMIGVMYRGAWWHRMDVDDVRRVVVSTSKSIQTVYLLSMPWWPEPPVMLGSSSRVTTCSEKVGNRERRGGGGGTGT